MRRVANQQTGIQILKNPSLFVRSFFLVAVRRRGAAADWAVKCKPRFVFVSVTENLIFRETAVQSS